MHVVDATLFYSPTSGGVKRYLLAKHDWMRTHTKWRHSLVVPGETDTHAPGDVSIRSGDSRVDEFLTAVSPDGVSIASRRATISVAV